MAVNTAYVDLGGLQRKEGGSGTAQTSYTDLGGLQRQEVSVPAGAPFSARVPWMSQVKNINSIASIKF